MQSSSLSVCRVNQGILFQEVCSDAAAPGDYAEGSGETGLDFVRAKRPGKLLQPPRLCRTCPMMRSASLKGEDSDAARAMQAIVREGTGTARLAFAHGSDAACLRMRALVIHLVPPLTRQSPSKAKKGDLCPSAQLQVHAETPPMSCLLAKAARSPEPERVRCIVLQVERVMQMVHA